MMAQSNHNQKRIVYVKFFLLASAFVAVLLYAFSGSKPKETNAPIETQEKSSEQFQTSVVALMPEKPPTEKIIPTRAQTPKEQKPAPQRFDHIVREDFFSGMAGDATAFNRGMKICEETLAKNPRHAEALVWHGSGLLFQGGQAFRKGDMQKGMELWMRGEQEMNQAVALEPASVGVLIPRGATLLTSSRYVPMPDMAKKLLGIGLGDYEKVLELQKPYFDKLSLHAKSELLWGLAEGWHRMGDQKKARSYFERIVSECSGSPYVAKAREFLDGKPPAGHVSCTGCHNR
ncbi:MAG: hypothetical protein AB1631_09855 [Acidobacteriota bacterium]